jgi:hypothetical protein
MINEFLTAYCTSPLALIICDPWRTVLSISTPTGEASDAGRLGSRRDYITHGTGETSRHSHPHFSNMCSDTGLPPTLCLPSGLILQGFHIKILYNLSFVSCLSHPIPLHFTTLIILREGYNICCSHFIHSNFILLHPTNANILSTLFSG